MQIHRARTLPRAELVGVRERILEQLHDRDDTRALILDLLDRRTMLTNIGEQQGNSAAALGKLQCRVDRAPDGLHIVFDAQEETTDRLAALLLTRVEEGRGSGLEAPVDDLVDQLAREHLVTRRQGQGHHTDPVLEPLQIALTVECLERVGGVVLERAEEGREPELLGVGLLEQRLDERAAVLLENLCLVIVLFDQVVQLLVEIVEEDGVLVDVLQEVLVRGLAVLVELDLTVGTVQVQHRVEGVVVHDLARIGGTDRGLL